MSRDRVSAADNASSRDPLRLLHEVTPFQPIAETMSRLVEICSEAFSLSACVAVWHLPQCLSGGWSRLGGETLTETCEISPGSAASLSEVRGEVPRAACGEPWEWLPVCGGDELVAEIGMAPLPSVEDRERWLAASATLLRWTAAHQQTLREQKLESLAEYAAGAGHEINNPLGSIIGRAAQLLKSERDPERRRALETIGAQAYRIRDMIGDTMLFGRPPEPRCERLLLPDLAREVCSKFEDEARERQVGLRLEVTDAAEVNADPIHLAIAVSELVRNGLEAAGPEGKVAVFLSRAVRDELGPVALIDVLNNGPPLNSTEQQHCFDPFFSGRQAGRGLGFGLTKCWRIVRLHGGGVRVDRVGEETRFRIELPVARGED